MRVDARYRSANGIRFEFGAWTVIENKDVHTLFGFTFNQRHTYKVQTERGYIKISRSRPKRG